MSKILTFIKNKHVIKISQIQKIVKISHIIRSRTCGSWVERVEKIMNFDFFQQRINELYTMRKEKHVNW